MNTLFALAIALSVAAPAAAPQTLFIVRHAERADAGMGASTTTDPDLSTAGGERAAALAASLKDAGITAIFTTQYKRTQQTAGPLADALGVRPIVIDAGDVKGLVAKLAGAGNALVVGHSNTVGQIITALGVPEVVTLADTDYDNLFIVQRGDPPVLIRLHFR